MTTPSSVPRQSSSKERKPGKQASRPPDRPAIVWAGLDVAKATFEAALDLPGTSGADPLRPLGGMPGCGFRRTPEDAAQFLFWALSRVPSGMSPGVAMEATGSYSKELAAWLRESDEEVIAAIVDPYKVNNYAKSLGTRNQTDAVDARIIARFATERKPAATPVSHPDYEALRELTRERQRVVEDRCRLQNRMSEGASGEFVRKQREENLAMLERHEKALDDEIERLTRESAVLRDDNKKMRQVPGVGPVIASVLQAEGGDPRRFATPRAYVAFMGLSPRTKESGTSVKRGRLSKRGSPVVRKMIYMGGMTIARLKKPNRLSLYYHRLADKGMKRATAMIAVGRKMLTTVHRMIQRDEPYDEAHVPEWRSDRNPKTKPPEAGGVK